MGCGSGAVRGVAANEGCPQHKVVPGPELQRAKSLTLRSKHAQTLVLQRAKSSTLGSKTSRTAPEELLDVPSNAFHEGGSGWSRSPKQTKRIILRQQSTMSTAVHGCDSVTSTTPSTNFEAGAAEFTEEESRFLSKALQSHFLFCSLEDSEREVMVANMERCIAAEGETIFKQGDEGDCFFVVQSGVFTVSIDDRPLKQLRQRATFGELALIYSVLRTGTVRCAQSGTLWSLGEQRFRQCMKTLNSQQWARVRSFLDSDQTFRSLSAQEKDALTGACSLQVFHRGGQILREGEVGDWIFILIEGNALAMDLHGNSVLKQPGAILGDVGLMCTGRQLVGAKATDHASCLAVGKHSLERLKGPVENMLRRHAIKSLVQESVGMRGREDDADFIGQLFDAQLTLLVDRLEAVTLPEGEAAISVGAVSQFIVMIEGEVALVSDQNVAQAGGGTLNLKEYATEVLTPGMTYGGRALAENSRMQEYAVALSPVRLYRMTHDAVEEALGEPLAEVIRLNEVRKVLLDVFLFKNMDEDHVDRTIRALKRRRYSAGEAIVMQGDDAKHFFLIQSGMVKVTKDGQKLRNLGRWDYFGERGLLLQEKRSATCEAETTCMCLSLEDETFREIVGMFRRDLENRMYLQDLDITMRELESRAIVGRGTFSIVKLVSHHKDTNKLYALKCVNKQEVVKHHQQKALLVERDMHGQCYHPCLVQFIRTFQDRDNVYFLTEFLGGGDLFCVIRKIGSLTKEQAQFYSGSIVLALEYLHGRGIMYRDLKPENILLDCDGNAKLVSLGCCKKALRATTLVGTPEYLAPEVILGKGYTHAIDWWALGVMLHEFVVGPLPFGRDTDDQLELFQQILEAPLEFPKYVSDESAVALVGAFLERAPELRAGSGARGAKEVQDHRYYNNFEWRALAGHFMTPPWSPHAQSRPAHWEVEKGQPLVDASVRASGPSDTEPGMDWAAVF